MDSQFWINTISRDHVEFGRAGGFTQADHGRSTRLKRLTRGDGIIFYSPRTMLHGGEPLQEFTAAGRVVDDEPYLVELTPEVATWRRRLAFAQTSSAAVRPLLAELDFITDPQHWGFPFRRGLFSITDHDADVILAAMGTDAIALWAQTPSALGAQAATARRE